MIPTPYCSMILTKLLKWWLHIPLICVTNVTSGMYMISELVIQMFLLYHIILYIQQAVFYEVFSSDNWYADDKQRFAILDKYFGSNSLVEVSILSHYLMI